jgi:NAD(P)-dependent dehydrogenase (short-subunit alcohol dehydrogenase family)
MSGRLSFDGKVAIVTGAGAGLGRVYALGLAEREAAVIVNDLRSEGAEAVADEIRAAGGRALAVAGSVTEAETAVAMADAAMRAWGRIDILVANAGIVRDKSFAKMTVEDFRLVVEVHLMGAVHACKAVWPVMQGQGYGRILLTTSAAGLFGNFGQANYSAAKMALIGLMQTLGIEGQKYGIHVNALAPTAATSMTEGILDKLLQARLAPEKVLPALLVLTHDSAPTRTILAAGGDSFEAVRIVETQGIRLTGASAEMLAMRLHDVLDMSEAHSPADAFAHVNHELGKAAG